jgi:hypothetical protein
MRVYAHSALVNPTANYLLIKYMELEVEMMNVNGVGFRVGVDKTTIGLKYPSITKKQLDSLDEQDKKMIIEAQARFFGEEMNLRKMMEGGNHKKHLMKNKTTRHIITDADGNYAFEFHLGRIAETRIINLQFNPSKMTPAAKAELDGLLSVSFNYGYNEFYSRAVISKLELFVDVIDTDVSEYILIDLGRRSKTVYANTTYLGKRNSRLTMANYDKALQLKTGDTIERYECRISNRSLYFKDYVEQEQKNPFNEFVLISRLDLQSIALSNKSNKLAATIENFGLYHAVANKYARESIKQQILNNRASWWEVDVFWNAIREQLQLLKPHSFLQ